MTISIHAPHTGGDDLTGIGATETEKISIHAPIREATHVL